MDTAPIIKKDNIVFIFELNEVKTTTKLSLNLD